MVFRQIQYLYCAFFIIALLKPALGAKETVFEKRLIDGRTLTVFHEKVPADPALVAKAEAFPGALIPDYEETYSFEASGGGGKTKKLLWTLTRPHYPMQVPPAYGDVRVFDADLQPEGLIVVFSEVYSNYADVIRPNAKGVLEPLRLNGLLSGQGNVQGNSVDDAKISGHLADGTLTVDLSRLWGAEHFLFHFVKDNWVPVPTSKPVPAAKEGK